MPDLPCRVAQLEANLKNETIDNKEFREEVKGSLKEISQTLQDMKLERAKQISYIGGVSTVVGLLATVVTLVVKKYF